MTNVETRQSSTQRRPRMGAWPYISWGPPQRNSHASGYRPWYPAAPCVSAPTLSV